MLTRKHKKPDVVFHWHPNFRVPDALPDIKPVRTGFLVNSAAVTFALLALAWMLYTEIGILRAHSETAALQARMTDEDIEQTNKTNLAMSGQFVTESRRVQDVTRFYAQALPTVPFLATLDEVRPENILFESVDVQVQSVEVAEGRAKVKKSVQRIVLTGTLTAENSDPLYAMVEKLAGSPVLKDRMVSAKDYAADAVPRSPGVFQFTITIVLKPFA